MCSNVVPYNRNTYMYEATLFWHVIINIAINMKWTVYQGVRIGGKLATIAL